MMYIRANGNIKIYLSRQENKDIRKYDSLLYKEAIWSDDNERMNP